MARFHQVTVMTDRTGMVDVHYAACKGCTYWGSVHADKHGATQDANQHITDNGGNGAVGEDVMTGIHKHSVVVWTDMRHTRITHQCTCSCACTWEPRTTRTGAIGDAWSHLGNAAGTMMQGEIRPGGTRVIDGDYNNAPVFAATGTE